MRRATALDVAGPAEVFAAAARRLDADTYRVKKTDPSAINRFNNR